MESNIEKPRNTKISRRRMLQGRPAGTAPIVVPGLALADDWIRVNSIPLTSSVPGRSSIMKARLRAPQPMAGYQPAGGDQPAGGYRQVRYTPPPHTRAPPR